MPIRCDCFAPSIAAQFSLSLPSYTVFVFFFGIRRPLDAERKAPFPLFCPSNDTPRRRHDKYMISIRLRWRRLSRAHVAQMGIQVYVSARETHAIQRRRKSGRRRHMQATCRVSRMTARIMKHYVAPARCLLHSYKHDYRSVLLPRRHIMVALLRTGIFRRQAATRLSKRPASFPDSTHQLPRRLLLYIR